MEVISRHTYTPTHLHTCTPTHLHTCTPAHHTYTHTYTHMHANVMNLFLIDLLLEKCAKVWRQTCCKNDIGNGSSFMVCMALHINLDFVEAYGLKPYKKTHTNHPISCGFEIMSNITNMLFDMAYCYATSTRVGTKNAIKLKIIWNYYFGLVFQSVKLRSCLQKNPNLL